MKNICTSPTLLDSGSTPVTNKQRQSKKGITTSGYITTDVSGRKWVGKYWTDVFQKHDVTKMPLIYMRITMHGSTILHCRCEIRTQQLSEQLSGSLPGSSGTFISATGECRIKSSETPPPSPSQCLLTAAEASWIAMWTASLAFRKCC